MKPMRVAAAVGEQDEGMTELYILTSFYLTENDVDYTANHHQSIEDVPGVPDIALNMAAFTASGRTEEGRRRGGCREKVTVRVVVGVRMRRRRNRSHSQ